MKKLFISVPMKDRTEEAIRTSMEKMHKIAEATVGEELKVIPSYIEDNPPKDAKEAVWYLGRSIQMMSEADYMVCINDMWEYSGCLTERDVAERYGIRMIRVSAIYVAPDILNKREGMAITPACGAPIGY